MFHSNTRFTLQVIFDASLKGYEVLMLDGTRTAGAFSLKHIRYEIGFDVGVPTD